MRKSYSNEFKLKAASMVLDEGQAVPEVCASLNVGPTALRRWVDQVRQERSGSTPVGPRRSRLTSEKSKNSKPCSGKKTGISKS